MTQTRSVALPNNENMTQGRICTWVFCIPAWDAVHVKTQLRGGADSLNFTTVDDAPDTTKVVCYDGSMRHVKVLYMVQHRALEPVADGVATLDLGC